MRKTTPKAEEGINKGHSERLYRKESQQCEDHLCPSGDLEMKNCRKGTDNEGP